KILSSRRPANDDALESRIISIRMRQNRPGKVNIMLDENEFKKDSGEIRAKLLTYRLKNYFKIDPNAYIPYVNYKISPRINKMIAPLICIRIDNKDFIEALRDKASEKNEQMKEDKSLSFDATVLKAIYMISIEEKDNPLLKDIVKYLNFELDRRHSSRFIGSFIRENFKFRSVHTRDGSAVIYENKKMQRLMKEYNISEIFEIKGVSTYDRIKGGIERTSYKYSNKRK
ncbi:MAG TPA: hypothetical protein DCY00_07555, partial [Actinobacteria bacterium]|nr:hypothetical protein [Actinomycetota bacterium]